MAGIRLLKLGIDKTRREEVQRLLGGLAGRGKFSAADVAMQAAVSRTITTGRKLVRDAISAEVKLRAADINSVIDIQRGSYEKPEGAITVTRRGIPLIKYLTSAQNAAINRRIAKNVKGRFQLGRLKISTRRRAQGGYLDAESLPHAFIAVMPNNAHRGIFQRRGKTRVPLKRLYGPTPLGVFMNAVGKAGGKTILEDTLNELGEVLEKNLLSQIDRFLK
jgi:hypothetical protein